MKLLAYQLSVSRIASVDDRRNHVNGIIHFLEEELGRQQQVDLIVLPELSTIEYSVEAFNKLPELAEPINGETFHEMAALAKRVGCAITYGFPRVENGEYYISQIVLSPSGHYLTHYDKIHLAQFGASAEKGFFSPGSQLGIFEMAGFRLGIIICYDFRFPELTRVMINKYAIDIIIHPVAFSQDGTHESWPYFVVSRALENLVYFLSVNRAGPGWGGSIFCPPWIDSRTRPIVMGEEERARLFTVDRVVLDSTREKIPFRQDRLSEYSILKPLNEAISD